MKRVVGSYIREESREESKEKAIRKILKSILQLSDEIETECDRFIELEEQYDLRALSDELLDTARFLKSYL